MQTEPPTLGCQEPDQWSQNGQTRCVMTCAQIKGAFYVYKRHYPMETCLRQHERGAMPSLSSFQFRREKAQVSPASAVSPALERGGT